MPGIRCCTNADDVGLHISPLLSGKAQRCCRAPRDTNPPDVVGGGNDRHSRAGSVTVMCVRVAAVAQPVPRGCIHEQLVGYGIAQCAFISQRHWRCCSAPSATPICTGVVGLAGGCGRGSADAVGGDWVSGRRLGLGTCGRDLNEAFQPREHFIFLTCIRAIMSS
jgi:hypothetical protein